MDFNIRIMIAETLVTVLYKQAEDSQAVDAAQSRKCSTGKGREASRRRADGAESPRKEQTVFFSSHNLFIDPKEMQL